MLTELIFCSLHAPSSDNSAFIRTAGSVLTLTHIHQTPFFRSLFPAQGPSPCKCHSAAPDSCPEPPNRNSVYKLRGEKKEIMLMFL